MTGAGGARRLEVFAVDVDSAQVCWSELPAGSHVLEVAGAPATTVQGPGAGSATIGGLAAGAEVRVTLAGAAAAPARTLVAPPGRELTRIATISDVHIGERRFGRWPRVRPGAEWREPEPYPVVCARAAMREAVAWGAQLLVVKGDLTDRDRDEEYEVLAAELASLPIPVLVIPGNHDGGDRVRGDGVAVLARHGIELTTGVRVVDVPGLRVIAASSREIGKHRGNLTHLLPEITEALSTAPGGALLATHHPPFRTVVTTIWPPGILGLDGWRLLRAVSAAHPDTVITAGHTHRNRRRAYRQVPITEVGSPKDYPGVWAGYVVHEGGIRQVVRRVADPQALAWTERTSGALMGWWRYWSRGSLDARCFSHTWTRSVDLVE